MEMPDAPLEITGTTAEAPPTPEAPKEFPVPGGTFDYKGFSFFKPRPDPATGHLTGGALIEVMLLALAASEDSGIKSFLIAAQIELRDVQNKPFFPRP